MSEHNHQCAFVTWFETQHAVYAKCLIAIPNGAHIAGDSISRAIKMKKLKAEGFKNGASDVFVAVPKHEFSGLWLEMKDQGKTRCSLKPDQLDHILLMRKMGYAAEWAAGVDQAISITQRYFSGRLSYE